MCFLKACINVPDSAGLLLTWYTGQVLISNQIGLHLTWVAVGVPVSICQWQNRQFPSCQVESSLAVYNCSDSLQVPEAIKEHYRNPAALLPLPQRAAAPVPEPAVESKASVEATPEEQEEVGEHSDGSPPGSWNLVSSSHSDVRKPFFLYKPFPHQ